MRVLLTNSLSRKKEELTTRVPGKLTFYSCGPTVYGLIHIGNLRGALVADLFYRYFLKLGFEVIYVRNYTDIDDKIIAISQKEGCESSQIATRYIAEVEKDYAVSGMLEPTFKTLATAYIPEMITMIEEMVEREVAYVSEGEVFFAIDQFESYGKLSGKKIDDLLAGIRVEISHKKKNPLDFTLWKPAQTHEPGWDSPWGRGRPGWHLECSAMARARLGNQIDVHHGGEDLLFPHHENEIAQTESVTCQAPFSRFWVHHSFLTLSDEKMSKSVGNILTAREFLTNYSSEVARYLLLSPHYRSRIDFSQTTIDHALSSLERLYEAKAQASLLIDPKGARSDLRAEAVWGSFLAFCEKTQDEISQHLANDLNTPGVLASVFSLIREFNRALGEPLARATPSSALGARELIRILESELGSVLGIGRLSPQKFFEDLAQMRARLNPELISESEILILIEKRNAARKAKDFPQADRVRDELKSKGIEIKDSPSGTAWKRV